MEKQMFVGKLQISVPRNDLWACVIVSNSPRFKLQRHFKSVCVVDDVPFGEVVLAPPSLSTKPKNAHVKSQVSCCAAAANSVVLMRDQKLDCVFAGLSVSSRRVLGRCSSTLSWVTAWPPQTSRPWPDREWWRRRGSEQCRPTAVWRNRGRSNTKLGPLTSRNSLTFTDDSCQRFIKHQQWVWTSEKRLYKLTWCRKVTMTEQNISVCGPQCEVSIYFKSKWDS